jgi:hypothetical protein
MSQLNSLSPNYRLDGLHPEHGSVELFFYDLTTARAFVEVLDVINASGSAALEYSLCCLKTGRILMENFSAAEVEIESGSTYFNSGLLRNGCAFCQKSGASS